jgi:hypothetical protein
MRHRKGVDNQMTDYNPWGDDYRPGLADNMKNVRGIGPLYIVVHRQRPRRRIMLAGMREIDPPYRWGRGIEIRLFGRTIGVGVCRRRKFDSDYVATREALNGRDISRDDRHLASRIGDWDG